MTTIDGFLDTARAIAWRTVLLTFLASLFYGPAYAAATSIRLARKAATFVASAAKLGWTDGRRGTP